MSEAPYDPVTAADEVALSDPARIPVPEQPENSSSTHRAAHPSISWPVRSLSRRTLLLGAVGIGAGLGGAGLAFLVRRWLLSPALVTYQTSGPIWEVTWSPDGGRIAAVIGKQGPNDIVRVWASDTGAHLLDHLGGGVAWSPDGRFLVSGPDAKSEEVWEVATGRTRVTYRGQRDEIDAVAWSPDGKQIASGSWDTTVQIWEAASGHPVRTYQGHTDAVYAVAWSPDGRWLASGGADQTVQIWDPHTGALQTTYTGHATYVTRLSWSPESQYVVSADGDNQIQVWEVMTGNQVVARHGGGVDTAATWSPRGAWIASVSPDDYAVVQIWEALTGKMRLSYTGHDDLVRSVSWSLDAKRLVSGSEDQTVQIWQPS